MWPIITELEMLCWQVPAPAAGGGLCSSPVLTNEGKWSEHKSQDTHRVALDRGCCPGLLDLPAAVEPAPQLPWRGCPEGPQGLPLAPAVPDSAKLGLERRSPRGSSPVPGVWAQGLQAVFIKLSEQE